MSPVNGQCHCSDTAAPGTGKMKAELQHNGNLVLTDAHEVRVVQPSHPAHATLLRLYHERLGEHAVALSSAHAPAGYTKVHPLVIQGDSFTGGEFIPAQIVNKATPLEKAEIKGDIRQKSP